MRAGSLAISGLRHALVAVGEAAVVALIVALVLLALSPIYRPAGTLLGTSGVDAGGRGVITVADGVFGGTTTGTLNPGGADKWAMAECYQGGVLVYRQYVKNGADNTVTFTLGPTPSWLGGPAACNAYEGTFAKTGRFRAIASTTFDVSG
jgi:hypothetical protein